MAGVMLLEMLVMQTAAENLKQSLKENMNSFLSFPLLSGACKRNRC
jgi:hypothetical protein